MTILLIVVIIFLVLLLGMVGAKNVGVLLDKGG